MKLNFDEKFMYDAIQLAEQEYFQPILTQVLEVS